MLFCCFKCRNNIENKNHKVARSKNRRILLLPNCAVCDSKKITIYQTERSCWIIK